MGYAFGSDLTPDGNFLRHYPVRRSRPVSSRGTISPTAPGGPYLGLWREPCRTAPRPGLSSPAVSAADLRCVVLI
jgi:hypothetical protein